jgi:MFS family permease
VNRNLRLLGIGFGIRTLGAALYNPFLALFLLNVMHLAYVEIGIIIAAVGVVLIPINYLGGLVTDRFGRRRLILIGLAAEALATGGLAYSFAVLSLAGAIAAALSGGIVTTVAAPAYSAYIADFASGSERTRGYTFYRVGLNAGFSAGVTLGGVLITLVGFAGAVAVAAAVVGAGAAFLGLLLEPSPRDVELGVTIRGRLPVDPAEPARPPARPVRQSLGLLARDRVALELLVAVALTALVTGQWAVTFPLFVHNVLGISYSLLGIGLALNGLVVVFGQTATTESVIGRKHTTIAMMGAGLYVVAFLGLGAAGLYGLAPVLVFFVAVAVLTAGENLLAIPQATLPSNIAPPDEVGSYNGAFGAVGGVGFTLSVLVGTTVLSLTANPLAIWLLLVIPLAPAVVLFTDAGRRIRPSANRA